MAVVLGALVSFGIAFVDERFSQGGLITIPLWQALLRQHTTRHSIRTGVLAA